MSDQTKRQKEDLFALYENLNGSFIDLTFKEFCEPRPAFDNAARMSRFATTDDAANSTNNKRTGHADPAAAAAANLDASLDFTVGLAAITGGPEAPHAAPADRINSPTNGLIKGNTDGALALIKASTNHNNYTSMRQSSVAGPGSHRAAGPSTTDHHQRHLHGHTSSSTTMGDVLKGLLISSEPTNPALINRPAPSTHPSMDPRNTPGRHQLAGPMCTAPPAARRSTTPSKSPARSSRFHIPPSAPSHKQRSPSPTPPPPPAAASSRSSNHCSSCNKYIFFFKIRCSVCGKTLCSKCVKKLMSNGRKCDTCTMGRSFSKRGQDRSIAGSGSVAAKWTRKKHAEQPSKLSRNISKHQQHHQKYPLKGNLAMQHDSRASMDTAYEENFLRTPPRSPIRGLVS